jgi:tRNA(Ile)-lysidine synthase
VLEAELGPGIAAALARSARLLSDDTDLLDSLAEDLLNRAATTSVGLDAGALLEAPAALRSRVIRMAAVASGCPRTDLTAEHVQAVESLLTAGGPHRSIDLPGSVQAVCRGVEVRFVRRDVGG